MTDTPLEQLPAEPLPPIGVGDLADSITGNDDEPRSVQRVGVVTAVEATGSRRVQVDIGGTTWCNRLQDTFISVGDRVSILQQDNLMLVIGRLTGTDAFSPIGALLPYAGASAPTNWLLCNGAAVSRTTYATLFSICGTTYGAGDGSTTFNVPDMRNRVAVGVGTLFTTRGAVGGASTVTLTDAQMPSHNHTLSGSATSSGDHGHSLSGSVGSAGSHSHSGDGAVGSRSDLLAGGGTNAATNSGTGSTGSGGDHSHSLSGSASNAGSHTHSLSGSVGSAGSDQAHENMPPYIVTNYIIRAI